MAFIKRFWNFYKVFRIIAAVAQITDDATLRLKLKDKIIYKLHFKLY